MRIAALLVLGMFIVASSLASPAPEAREKAAESGAQSLLALVDSGQYGESWETAAALLVLGMFIAASSRASPTPETREKAAESVAQSWLALVDSGQYGESWDAAAALFKQSVTRSQWVDALTRVRSPLGKLESRKFRGAMYVTDMPGAPAGEYVVIEYDATFAGGVAMIERITPMKDPDGVWRVSGYFLLPAK